MELDIEVLSTYTGNKWTDVVDAVALKDFNSGSYSNFSLVSAPDGVSNWNLSQNELNAKGLMGGNSGGAWCGIEGTGRRGRSSVGTEYQTFLGALEGGRYMVTKRSYEVKISIFGAGETFEEAIDNAIEIFNFKSYSCINEDTPEDGEKE